MSEHATTNECLVEAVVALKQDVEGAYEKGYTEGRRVAAREIEAWLHESEHAGSCIQSAKKWSERINAGEWEA